MTGALTRIERTLLIAAPMIAVAGAAAIGGEPFARFFGPVEPLLVVAAATALGSAALYLLAGRHGFAIARLRGLGPAVAVAVAMAGAAIALDLLARFPRDINVRWPESLVFYPVIALVVESLFHLTPVAILVFALRGRRYWIAAAAVSLLEPAFQLAAGTGAWGAPLAAHVYLAVHLYAFNLCQLYLFRRRGFAAMLGFRVAYYLCWHVAWGEARLQLLF